MTGTILLGERAPSVGKTGHNTNVVIRRTGDLSGSLTVTCAITPDNAAPDPEYKLPRVDIARTAVFGADQDHGAISASAPGDGDEADDGALGAPHWGRRPVRGVIDISSEVTPFQEGGLLCIAPYTDFSGAAGSDDIKLAHFNDNDSASLCEALVNRAVVGSWVVNARTPNAVVAVDSRVIQTIAHIDLHPGDDIVIHATRNLEDYGRVDTLTFAPGDALE